MRTRDKLSQLFKSARRNQPGIYKRLSEIHEIYEYLIYSLAYHKNCSAYTSFLLNFSSIVWTNRMDFPVERWHKRYKLTSTFGPWSIIYPHYEHASVGAGRASVYLIQYTDQSNLQIAIPFLIDMNCLLPWRLCLPPITGLYSNGYRNWVNCWD